MSEQSGGPGWWLASDGKWYPPVPPSMSPVDVEAAPSTSDYGGHYEATVNRGSLNMATFTRELNQRWKRGWKLGQVFEQSGNTVIVWERRT